MPLWQAQALLVNFKLGWKGLPGTDQLIWPLWHRRKKSLIRLTPGQNAEGVRLAEVNGGQEPQRRQGAVD